MRLGLGRVMRLFHFCWACGQKASPSRPDAGRKATRIFMRVVGGQAGRAGFARRRFDVPFRQRHAPRADGYSPASGRVGSKRRSLLTAAELKTGSGTAVCGYSQCRWRAADACGVLLARSEFPPRPLPEFYSSNLMPSPLLKVRVPP